MNNKAYPYLVMSLPTNMHKLLGTLEVNWVDCELRSPDARQYRSHGMSPVGRENASMARDALTNHSKRAMSGVAPNRCGVSLKVVSIFDYQVPQYL